jgi:hypothetical protein
VKLVASESASIASVWQVVDLTALIFRPKSWSEVGSKYELSPEAMNGM